MSRLPLEDRNVWGVPGPDYEPKAVCAHPFCNRDGTYEGALEKHHLWPRSFLRNQPQTWVKLPDGTEIGNLIYLCREHHQQITENKARIIWENSVIMRHEEEGFWWTEGDDRFLLLNPQPPRALEEWPEDRGSDSKAVDDFPEEDVEPIVDDASEWHVHEGQECPTCHRRVPKKKKVTTPTTKVVSFRLPLDEAPEFEEIIEAAAKHRGVYENSFWKYVVLLQGLVVLLQGPAE